MEEAQEQETSSKPLQLRPRPKWVPKFRATSERKADEAASENAPVPPQQPEPEPQETEAAAEAEGDDGLVGGEQSDAKLAELEASGEQLAWNDSDVDAVLAWCYAGDQSRVPNRTFGRGGRLPKLINILSNSCSYVSERAAELHPKTWSDTATYTVPELRALIKPFARRVLLAIEERESAAASRKRPLEIWETEMAQEQARNEKQRKMVDMRLPRIDPAIITRDLSRSPDYIERLLEDKRTDIWTSLHEEFVVQWAQEHLSRIPTKAKQEGRLERFLRTVTNSCVEINELLDNSPEIWAVEQEIYERDKDYFLHTDSLTGTKQKLNADGSVHLRIAVVREQFVVHLAKRVLDIVDRKMEEESESGAYSDDDDGDSDDSFL